MDTIYEERQTSFRANGYRNQKGGWRVQINVAALDADDARELVAVLAKATREFRRSHSQVIPLHPNKTG